MRRSVTVLVVVTAGLAARAAVRSLARRRAAAAVPVAVTRPAAPVAVVAPRPDAVVLPFPRRAPAAPAPAPAAPARCGETGGRTKAGAPCAARATAGGRCHHHRVAA
jgi:hypothetical protein